MPVDVLATVVGVTTGNTKRELIRQLFEHGDQAIADSFRIGKG